MSLLKSIDRDVVTIVLNILVVAGLGIVFIGLLWITP